MKVDGVICVFRRSYRFESFQYDGDIYTYSKLQPHYIFALTDSWGPHGTPVEWSVDSVLDRLRKIDGWHRDTMGELLESYDKADRASDRDRHRKHEDLALEMRPQLAKAFNDFNLSSVKKPSSREVYEKKKGKLTL